MGNRNAGDTNIGDGNTGYGNTGDTNTGNWNTGNGNTGDGNTGSRNAGDWNRGDWNAGNWNMCNYSNGFFNTQLSIVMVFNKPCKCSVWHSAIKPNFIYFMKEWSDCLKHITIDEIAILQQLPNFNEEIFKKISGFSIKNLYRYEILFRKFFKKE